MFGGSRGDEIRSPGAASLLSVVRVIRLIDVANDHDMRQIFEVGVAAGSHDQQWFSPISYESWLVRMRRPDPEDAQELYGFFDEAGRCRGSSLLFIPLEDNTDKVYSVVDVAPVHRRQGIGRALVERNVQRARALGRPMLFAETLVPGVADPRHPFVKFARATGFSPGWDEVARHLPLPIPQHRLDELAAAGAGVAGGDYDVEVFVDGVPERHLAGLAELLSLLAVDAPSGDIDFEAEAITPDRLRRTAAREREQGRTRLSALAIHRSTGVVAAQSDLIVDPGVHHASQLATYVHREHRGRHLGMAVKVANLQRLQRIRPDISFVRTMNAETNDHMISINVELGFEVVETLTEWTIDVG